MQKLNKKQIVFKILFVFTIIIYICALSHASFFKYVHITELFSPDRYFTRGLNLIPFNTYGDKSSLKFDIIINFIMYAPMGFLIAMNTNGKNHRIAYLTILPVCSIFAESMQYIFALGGTDITDLIMNTLGGICGFLLYIAIKKLFKNCNKLDNILIILMTLAACFILFLML